MTVKCNFGSLHADILSPCCAPLYKTMLGLVLFGLMEHEFSLKFLQNALTLAARHHGSTSLKRAHW